MNTLTPLGGLIGAILGGILWAKYIQWTGNTAGFIAIAIGIFTGTGTLLVAAMAHRNENTGIPWHLVSIAAALFAVIGIFIGKYLDVQWNAVAQITEQLMQEQHLSHEQAAPIAKTVFKGHSVWELMRDRLAPFDLVYIAVAAFVAYRIPAIKPLRKILNVS